MIFAGSVRTVLTFAGCTTCHAQIEALTVLFLALTLLAVASFALMLSAHQLMADVISSFANLGLMVLVIRAAIARAIISAHFSLSEALAVHLEALALVAVAASVLILFWQSALLLQHPAAGRSRKTTNVSVLQLGLSGRLGLCLRRSHR